MNDEPNTRRIAEEAEKIKRLAEDLRRKVAEPRHRRDLDDIARRARTIANHVRYSHYI